MASDIYFVVGASGFVGRSVRALLQSQSGVYSQFPSRASVLAELQNTVSSCPEKRLLVLNLAWPGLAQVTSTGLAAPGDVSKWLGYLGWLKELFRLLKVHRNFRYFGVGSGIERYSRRGSELVEEPYLMYGHRKDLVRSLAQTELQGSAFWLRLHYLFGPHEEAMRFVPAALAACRQNRPLLLNAPNRRRHWIYVDDAARGMVGAMRQDAPKDWDIVGTRAISFQEMCELVESQVGRSLVVQPGRPTADARCLSVEPENPAPFLDAAIGSREQLVSRLATYDSWINANEPNR